METVLTFFQQIFVENLHYAGHCARCLEYKNGQTKLYPTGAYKLNFPPGMKSEIANTVIHPTHGDVAVPDETSFILRPSESLWMKTWVLLEMIVTLLVLLTDLPGDHDPQAAMVLLYDTPLPPLQPKWLESRMALSQQSISDVMQPGKLDQIPSPKNIN